MICGLRVLYSLNSCIESVICGLRVPDVQLDL